MLPLCKQCFVLYTIIKQIIKALGSIIVYIFHGENSIEIILIIKIYFYLETRENFIYVFYRIINI